MDEPFQQKPEKPDIQPVEMDFDFGYRPDYWAPASPLAVIIGNIVGVVRRRAIELSLRHGEAASLALLPEDREDFLSEERRIHLASLHSLFTGGEYLPPYLPGEIEIGRFVLNTTQLDVIAFRVRREEGELHYRVVDERGQENFSSPALSSDLPLTFGELVEFLDSVELHGDWKATAFVEKVLEFNIKGGAKPDILGGFITPESYHYPELGPYFIARIQDWIRQFNREGEDSVPW